MVKSRCTRHTEDTDEGRPGEFVWVFEGLEEEQVFLNDVVLVLLIEETLIEISKRTAQTYRAFRTHGLRLSLSSVQSEGPPQRHAM